MVRMSDTAYAVESFELLDDGESRKQLTIEGWFHARVGVRGMQLAIPDQPLMIAEFRQPSHGLISMFGETGRDCRFRMQLRLDGDAEPKLPGTRLLVLLENNDGMTIDVSPSLRIVRREPPRVWDEADQALVMRFEGLGDNCEFGLMQREVGRERLSLLRYAGSRTTELLVDAIRTGLDGFGTPDDLAIDTFHGEWIATSRRYGFTFHTGQHQDAYTAEQIRDAESTKLTFMAGMLVEDMETCSKVFVRRRGDEWPTAGMAEVYDALRARGPATLLWVTPAEEGKPHGTVEHVRERLFRGYHERFAPYSSAIDYDSASWVVLLRQAEAVIAAHGADGARRDAAPETQAPTAEHEEAAPMPAEPVVIEEPPPEYGSWRVLTADEPPPDAAPPPNASEIEPPPDDGGFIGRLFGRKRPENT